MSFVRQRFRGKEVGVYNAEKAQWIIKIPPVFSFLRNSDETLNTLFSLVAISMSARGISEIFFDHSQLQDMDMGASVVLDVLAMNLEREWAGQGRHVTFAGQFPKDPFLCEVLKSMGITKHLRVAGAEPSPAAERLFVRFPLHMGYKQHGSELGGKQHRERAASDLVLYLNRCLQTASRFALKDEGQRQILRWAAEIITNAEEHSGHHQWYVIGCMTPLLSGDREATNQAVIGECQLTIFGFGKTIYESLSSPDTPEETRNQLAQLAAKHSPFFNPFLKYYHEVLGRVVTPLLGVHAGFKNLLPVLGQVEDLVTTELTKIPGASKSQLSNSQNKKPPCDQLAELRRQFFATIQKHHAEAALPAKQAHA
jgi:hypothetical protein